MKAEDAYTVLKWKKYWKDGDFCVDNELIADLFTFDEAEELARKHSAEVVFVLTKISA